MKRNGNAERRRRENRGAEGEVERRRREDRGAEGVGVGRGVPSPPGGSEGAVPPPRKK